MPSIPFRVRRSLVASLTVMCALGACGGGGGSTSTGSPTSTTNTTSGGGAVAKQESGNTGTITGFGSVIVEGKRYDDSNAVVKSEQDPTAPTTGSTSSLKLGQRVDVKLDANGGAMAITVQSEVVGTIASLVSGGFIVAGQTVKISTDSANPTTFDGVADLSGLAVNDFVEVHGQRNATDEVVASRIERKDPSSVAAVRVLGTIGTLDATAKTFTMGGLVVSYGGAQRIAPLGVVLANGQRVAVWSDTAVSGNALNVKALAVKNASSTASNGDVLRVAGLIRDLNFASKSFRLDTFDVDASGATFDQGTANDLANGRPVRIMGTFANGKLTATEVKFRKNQDDALVELIGAVSDFVSSASFKVRGVPVDASGTGITFKNGDASNLADGVVVSVKGAVVNNVVKPTLIELTQPPEGALRPLAGPVRDYNANLNVFFVRDARINLTSATTFLAPDGTPGSRSAMANGIPVLVKGNLNAGVFTATEVRFTNGPARVVDSAEGVAYDVDTTASTLKINGISVNYSGVQVVGGSLTNLRNGVRVEVKGSFANGVLTARQMGIKQPV